MGTHHKGSSANSCEVKLQGMKIKLLSHIRQDLASHGVETIYKDMMLPLLLFCDSIFIDFSPNKKQKLEGIQMRCIKIVNGKRNSVKLPSINHTRNKMCAIEFFKFLNEISPPGYEKHFKRFDHCKGTRGNHHSLLLPRVQSETGRKTFTFWGAKIFNKLSSDMKTESSIVKFKTACKDFNFDF